MPHTLLFLVYTLISLRIIYISVKWSGHKGILEDGFPYLFFQDGCAVPLVHFASPMSVYVEGESNLRFAVIVAFSNKHTLYCV